MKDITILNNNNNNNNKSSLSDKEIEVSEFQNIIDENGLLILRFEKQEHKYNNNNNNNKRV